MIEPIKEAHKSLRSVRTWWYNYSSRSQLVSFLISIILTASHFTDQKNCETGFICTTFTYQIYDSTVVIRQIGPISIGCF
jgi:hypothetical protein